MSAQEKGKCPRCAAPVEEGAKFCQLCGAPLAALQANKRPAKPSRMVKALVFLLGALVLAMAALVVLLLEGQGKEPGASATPDLYAAASTLGATEEPEEEPARIVGTWVAARIQNNTNQSKEIVFDSVVDEERMVMRFSDDGEVLLLVMGEEAGHPVLIEDSWYGEGEDYFIDAGRETVYGETYFGRNRYFFRDEELFYVYTLDGIEVTDFIVFAPAGEADSARLEKALGLL